MCKSTHPNRSKNVEKQTHVAPVTTDVQREWEEIGVGITGPGRVSVPDGFWSTDFWVSAFVCCSVLYDAPH
jgi:hypothetical protein